MVQENVSRPTVIGGSRGEKRGGNYLFKKSMGTKRKPA